MPHKDRETRLAYLRAWKARHRPSPAAKPQPAGDLPQIGLMRFSDAGDKVQCHVCGQWLGALNMHIRRHGLDARSYKEAFGLPRTISMWPPVTQAKQREAALARDQGDIGRDYLPHDGTGRPAGQEARLGVRISASDQRKGLYTRGGAKTKRTPNDPAR